MYKIVPKKKRKKENSPQNVAGLLKTRVELHPVLPLFLVTEERGKPLPNQSAIERTTKEWWFHQKRLNE